ncbi:hypothetical protein [Nocardia salmonicida]|uniref:hypothetical protein n=1 Tax=Nocardia salmonicida TaxID=53431 RepID=UPI0007A3E21B|nr:hypothetical protein [Nocardia salmonicida]MBC7299490.1 hypothetical protein [Nocardia sp.]
MSQWEIDKLNYDELSQEFGADRRWLREPGFPDSHRDADGQPRWHADQVWAWLAAHAPDAAAVVPLQYWPRGDAVYQQAREIKDAVVQDWSVHGIVLRLLWPTVLTLWGDRLAAEASTLVPQVPRVIRIRSDFGFRGPTLAVHDEHGTILESVKPVWPELALLLGGRAPYWPDGLRDTAAMRQWQPGDPTAIVSVTGAQPDPAPLLRLADTLPDTTTAHAVLVNLAHGSLCRASNDVAETVKEMAADPNRAQWTVLAATNPPAPEPVELNDVVLRDGWLSVTARTDTLAHEAVLAVLASGHTDGFPYTAAERVDPSAGLGVEWAARLLPTAPSAGFQILYGHLAPGEEATITDYLTDPATDAPAVRLASGDIVAAVPHRLPTTSALAALTLDKPIWVRLADGTIHFVPRRDAPGINWGYRGSGTSTLAQLIADLLDDITAPAPERFTSDSPGLEKLLTTDWPHNTTFARDQLDTAHQQR